MMMCPECKKEIERESRQCPKYSSEPVCIKCCYSCEHYNKDDKMFMYVCKYYINNPVVEISQKIYDKCKEIENLKAEQLHMKRRASFLRNKNLAFKAVSCDMRVRELDVLISKAEREKEELINERDKSNC